MRWSGTNLILGALLLVTPALAAAAPRPAAAPEAWWLPPHSAGDSLRVLPEEGGWTLRWIGAPGQELRLSWPTDPSGFPGRYLAIVDGGREGVNSTEVGPAGWTLGSDRAVLITRPRDIVAAMVGLVRAPAGAGFTWTKPGLREPLRETFPAVILTAPAEGGEFEVWFADAAPPDSLHAAWAKVAHRAQVATPGAPLPSARALPRGFPARTLTEELSRWPEVVRQLGMNAVLLDPGSFSPAVAGESAVAVARLREAGLEYLLALDPLRFTVEEARELPRGSVGRFQSSPEDGRARAYPAAGWPARRALTQRATRGLAAGAAGFILEEPPGPGQASPPETRIWMERFLIGASGRPVGRNAGGRELDGNALLTLAWRAPLPERGRIPDIRSLSLTGKTPGEVRLAWMAAALSGGPFVLDGESWALSGEELGLVAAALPPLGRGARSTNLFSLDDAGTPGPARFVLDGADRETRVILNLSEQPAMVGGRAGLGEGAVGGPPEVIVYDSRFDTVLGRFSRLENLPLTVGARDARWVSVVGDPGRPVLVGTRAHWTQGIAELREERWDARRGELILELGRVPGAPGTLVVACETAPTTYRLEGGEVRGPGDYRKEGGVGVYRLPIEWKESLVVVHLRFSEADRP